MSSDDQQLAQLIQRGQHLLDVNRPADAIAEFSRALALAPENCFVLCNLARAQSMLGQFDVAKKTVVQAIAANPNEEWAFRIKAHLHLRKDQKSSAYKAATRSLQLDPENNECLYMLAICAYNLNRLDEATMLGDILRKQAPESTYGHSIPGDVAARRDEHAEAAGHYEEVLKLDPNDAATLEALASIRNAHNKFGDSVSLLRGALSVDPNPEVRRNSFKDSMNRFALIGQANERRKSVAGLLVTAFMAYLLIWLIIATTVGITKPFDLVFTYGLAMIVLAGIPFLRARFFSSQSSQLQLLYASFSRDNRKRTLLATVVIIGTAYGIAGLIYLDVGDASIFMMPIAIFMAAIWIYMLAITLRLGLLGVSDAWTRWMGSDVPVAKRGLPIAMILLPAITAISLAFAVWNDHNLAQFAFAICGFLTMAVYFVRYRFWAGITGLAVGTTMMSIPSKHRIITAELTIGGLGSVLLLFGIAAMLLDANARIRRYWQRRRIGRLLSNNQISDWQTESD